MSWVLAYLVPVVVQVLAPVLTALVKQGVAYVGAKLPGSVVVPVVGVLSEAINQGQSALTGVSLPPGVGALVAILLRELYVDVQAVGGSGTGKTAM